MYEHPRGRTFVVEQRLMGLLYLVGFILEISLTLDNGQGDPYNKRSVFHRKPSLARDAYASR